MYESEMEISESATLGKAHRMVDAQGRYIEACKASIPINVRLKGLKIVLDCSNGATYDIAPKVFAELGAKVVSTGDKPDGLNINYECGSTDPEHLVTRVKVEGADLGIAFDGDGDRVLMVDNKGEVVDGDELLYIIATARQDRGLLQGGVVGTVMSNFGLELALKERHIPFMRTPVGDRHVHKALTGNGWTLGGEASGHLLCLDRTSTGDGIVSALQVLEVMVSKARSLAELTTDVQKLPQVMINVPISGEVSDLGSSETINAAVKSVQNQLGDTGRVILRPSGTEPLIRVTLEGIDATQVNQLAEELAEVVRNEL